MSVVQPLRERGGKGDGKIAMVELFFDLIFVFTIIQLSHTLADHFSAVGLVEAMVLMLAVWWVWIYTTWVTNWLDPENSSVRAMLFVLMFLGLMLSTSIPQAFGDRALVFALAYVSMQLGRTVFTLWEFRTSDAINIHNFQRITVWFLVSAPLWIAGALFEEHRLLYWLGALGVEYAAPVLGYFVPGLGRSMTSDWRVSGEHMAERCALFVIICLGETILVSGQQFTELSLTPHSLLAFAVAFATTVVLWWVYFRYGHGRAAEQIEESDDPGRLGRLAYTYAHIPIVVGIIVTAVGAYFMLGHFDEPAKDEYVVALVGGPLIYLLGNGWFKAIAYGRPPLSHGVGVVLLVLGALLARSSSTLFVGGCALTAMAVVAVWEMVALDQRRAET